MSFWGRLWQGISGQAKKRLPKQMELLGAPLELVEKARRAPEEAQEALFLDFTDGRHACALDWKATPADVVEGLLPLLSEDEKKLVPSVDDLPEDSGEAIAKIRSQLAAGPRTLVHTESLGDFSILIVVPKEKEQEFLRCAGPWLIA